MTDSLVTQLETLVKSVTLTRQDVLELTECIIQEYLTQQQSELGSEEDEENERQISVECDDDGDYIDKEGYIYDIKTHIRIGQKDLKTKEKTMFNVI